MVDIVDHVTGLIDAPARRRRTGVLALARFWLGERLLWQAVLYLGTLALFGYLGSNLFANMRRLGLSPGFAFLDHAANFGIGETLIHYAAGDSYLRAIVVGLLNTVEVSITGCLLATVIGVGVGVARLSANPLISRVAQGYVEILRNTPLLLQLFAWSQLLHLLPNPRQALQPLPGVRLSNRGLFLPSLDAGGHGATIAVAGLLLAGLAAVVLRWQRRSTGRTGPGARVLAVVVPVGLPLLAVLIAGVPMAIDVPALKGFNIVGGLTLTPEFAALALGLAVNASASIAETVRGGILSVARGQWEAGESLGLHRLTTLRLIILPQALRIIVPVMTSSYLSLAKNSSLAVAIGFPELVSILNTTANVTGQALETIFIMMVVYLSLSLLVSVLMNAYNRRSAIWAEARR